jgi:hypothetical protein
MTWTQTTVNIKDASGVSQPVIAYTDGTNFSFAHPLLDNTGAVISPAQASAIANTTGGTSTYAALGGTGNALLTNTPVAVKASAGNVYGLDFVNPGSSAAYVQIFDVAAASVTLGTTVPKLSKWIPAFGGWEEKFAGETKISFGTAITVAATTTPTGNTAPATGIIANIVYK